MTPEDLAAVDRSWTELRHERAALVDRLNASFGTLADCDQTPVWRARWLVDAVSELVGLLTAPSQLEAQARRIATTWPDHCPAPSFGIEGRAWMDAAEHVSQR